MPFIGKQNVDSFKTFYRDSTRQIGTFFCIPASVSNALRVLGDNSFTQERIRDHYYKSKGRKLEADLDQQMTGASFDVVDALKASSEFAKNFDTEAFSRPEDRNPFVLDKADEAVSFIKGQLRQDRPVVVSTWVIPWHRGSITPIGYHILLVLGFDEDGNWFVVHDPAEDQHYQMRCDLGIPVILEGRLMELPIGLKGQITHTDYNCLSFFKTKP